MTQEEIKKNKQRRQYLTLIVSHTLLMTVTVLVIVMLKAYLRLTEKKFRHRKKTSHDPKPCCAVGATSQNKKINKQKKQKTALAVSGTYNV